jgi:hypothetical protein
VTWEERAAPPASLYGMIPSGTSFPIPIDPNANAYDWTVNVAAGTQYLLAMSDAGQFGTGGSTSLMQVQSGTSSCRNATSPGTIVASSTSARSSSSASASASSTSSANGATGTGGTSSGGAADPANNGSGSSKSGSTNVGAIAGGVVGGVVFLALLAILLFCCIRRRGRRDPKTKSYGTASGGMAEKERNRRPADLFGLGALGARRGSEEEGLAGRRASGALPAGEDFAAGEGRPVELDDALYEPRPFRSYPAGASPGSTVGGVGGAGLAGAAGAAGFANHSRHMSDSKTNASPYAPVPNTSPGDSPRHSAQWETPATPTIGAGNGTGWASEAGGNTVDTHATRTPDHLGPLASHAPLAPFSATTDTRSEEATDGSLGHAQTPLAGPARHSSIRKVPSGQIQNQSLGLVNVSGGGGEERMSVYDANQVMANEGPGPRDSVTRFVQHEDAGEVV